MKLLLHKVALLIVWSVVGLQTAAAATLQERAGTLQERAGTLQDRVPACRTAATLQEVVLQGCRLIMT